MGSCPSPSSIGNREGDRRADEAGVDDADEAVARAKGAFPGWRAGFAVDRLRLLWRIAMVVEQHADGGLTAAYVTPL
jgi:acyl-CoA reductase-like NAD-dependent aldehyde dehydrogenase